MQWSSLAEMGLIAAWAIWVGRPLLDLDVTVWLPNVDFIMGTFPYFSWSLLTRCGACVLWNGYINGGMPAAVDIVGALHPLMTAMVVAWGTINGAKMSVVVSLVLAGLAQWWLARVLRLGLVPRLWGAGLAVVGGHVAGRIAGGLFGMAFSIAATSLIIPAGLALALNAERRATVCLGVMLALALLSGQGYAQLGLALGLLPAFAVFLVDDRLRLRPLWREFALACILALLLAAILWVPLLHFWPNSSKPTAPTTRHALEYAPLELVIRDKAFQTAAALGRSPYPAVNVNYVGWIPVLFALASLRLVPTGSSRVLIFFVTATILIYLLSSGVTFRLLAVLLPRFVAILRNPPLIAGLAVPLILGLATWGLDRLSELNWPRLTLTLNQARALDFRLTWPVLVPLLIWSVKLAYDFNRPWLVTTRVNAAYYHVVQEARSKIIDSGTSAWVRFPDDPVFIPVAVDAGLKVTGVYRSFNWRDRAVPPASLQVVREAVDTSSPDFVGSVSGLSIVAQPGNDYASVDVGSGTVPCQAVATGGNIDVDCETDVPGTLIVRENQWSGWRARRDGTPVRLGAGQWLSVSAPAGQHHYEFRYRPWDVALGGLLTLVGIALALWLWTRPVTPGLNEGAALGGVD